jgi:hypothetical protein
MKNSTFKSLSLGVCFLLLLTNCEKSDLDQVAPEGTSEVKNQQVTSKSNQQAKPTLAEFIREAETADEIAFFQNTGITDNTSIVDQGIANGQQAAKPKIKFRWHGKGAGEGCKKPLGVCIIIPIGLAEANADLIIYNNTYIIVYDQYSDDNGLTSDGYLPIMEDIYVDENITVAAGIYKANFDSTLNRYSAVGIDIK